MRTAKMLFLKAVYDLFGAKAAQESTMEFTIGRGLYVNTSGYVAATAGNAEQIKDRMRQLVEAKAPFMKRSYPLEEAMELFRSGAAHAADAPNEEGRHH